MDLPNDKNTISSVKSQKKSSPALLLDQASPEPKESFKSVKLWDDL